MKEINLKKIYEKEYSFCPANSLTNTQVEFVIYAMREACNQVVNLCAENAVTTQLELGNNCSTIIINKESILKTKDQIK